MSVNVSILATSRGLRVVPRLKVAIGVPAGGDNIYTLTHPVVSLMLAFASKVCARRATADGPTGCGSAQCIELLEVRFGNPAALVKSSNE